MTIFDLITSNELQAYWEEAVKGLPPYLGESLFDEAKKLGLDIKWIKGAKGLPVVLKPSAFDAAAIPRKRIGFDTVYLIMSRLFEKGDREGWKMAD